MNGAWRRKANTAAATEPACAMWLSLMRPISDRSWRWLKPPPLTTAYLEIARSIGIVLRVSSTRTLSLRAASATRCVRVEMLLITARKFDLADASKVNLKGAVSWSFEFENQPYFYGFRDLATNGIDKPVLNVFRMFGKMAGQRVEVSGKLNYNYAAIRDSSARGAKSDINAIASKANNSSAVMIWNYHDDDINGPDANIDLHLRGLPNKPIKMFHYRIDNEHSNAYEVWKKMGSPQNPTKEQITILEKAGELKLLNKASFLKAKNGVSNVQVSLPRQGVSLLKFDW